MDPPGICLAQHQAFQAMTRINAGTAQPSSVSPSFDAGAARACSEG